MVVPHQAQPQTFGVDETAPAVRVPVGPWAALTAGGALVAGSFIWALAPAGEHIAAALGVVVVLFGVLIGMPVIGIVASRIRSIATAAPLLVFLSTSRLFFALAIAVAVMTLREIDGTTYWIAFMAAALGSLIGETAAAVAAMRRAQDEHRAHHAPYTPQADMGRSTKP
ncbi:MAG: hypothetical protein EA378_08025 [Phycisphaerales bacterium]|nr:MAG: hypothetical protein EA378_08025 [Phycisphaerales bacterium]